MVLQNAETGDVLFVGYANEHALRETLATKSAVLWSTSRNELWRKGATSGDVLDLVEVRVNCEQNSLLYRVRPRGGVCHTTRPTMTGALGSLHLIAGPGSADDDLALRGLQHLLCKVAG